jgi:putative ABC transport system permease protein
MAIDRWKEGYREPGFGDAGRPLPEGPPPVPTFRIYAADLAAVAPLAEKLTRQGLDVATNADEINRTLILSRTLDIVFTTIALVAGAGYLFSLGASLWANVARKRHELSVLRLQGLERGPAMAFPGSQGVSIALGGFIAATLLYLAAALTINTTLGFGFEEAGEGRICRLEPWHFALAGAASLLIGLAAAGVAARRITLIDPVEGIRHA